MTSAAIELSQLRAIEQVQQPLDFAAIVGGGVELEGKSASIKSSWECIRLSNASTLSTCIERCSAAGSRRQLSIRNNKRKGGSDEPDALLLLERELAAGEGDVDIGGKRAIRPTTFPNTNSTSALASKPNRYKEPVAHRSTAASPQTAMKLLRSLRLQWIWAREWGMHKRKSFRPWQPEQTTLLPPSPCDWLSHDHQRLPIVAIHD